MTGYFFLIFGQKSCFTRSLSRIVNFQNINIMSGFHSTCKYATKKDSVNSINVQHKPIYVLFYQKYRFLLHIPWNLFPERWKLWPSVRLVQNIISISLTIFSYFYNLLPVNMRNPRKHNSILAQIQPRLGSDPDESQEKSFLHNSSAAFIWGWQNYCWDLNINVSTLKTHE